MTRFVGFLKIFTCMRKRGVLWGMCGVLGVICGGLSVKSHALGVGDGVVAVINDEIMTVQDLAGFIALKKRQLGEHKVPENRLRQQVLQEAIEGELKRQYALTKGFTATEQKMMQVKQALAAQNGLEIEELDALTAGLENVMQTKLRERVLWDQVIQLDLMGKIEVSTAELDRMIKDMMGGEVVSEREISQLFVATGEESAARAMQAREMFLAQKEFVDVVQAINPKAKKGGYLGWFDKGSLQPELETALKGVKAGALVGPIETDLGVHWVKVHRLKTVPEVSFEPIEQLLMYRIEAMNEEGVQGMAALLGTENLIELKAHEALRVTELGKISANALEAKVRQFLPEKLGLGAPYTYIKEGEEKAVRDYVAERQWVMSPKLLALRKKVEFTMKNTQVRLLERKLLRDLQQRAFVDIVGQRS